MLRCDKRSEDHQSRSCATEGLSKQGSQSDQPKSNTTVKGGLPKGAKTSDSNKPRVRPQPDSSPTDAQTQTSCAENSIDRARLWNTSAFFRLHARRNKIAVVLNHFISSFASLDSGSVHPNCPWKRPFHHRHLRSKWHILPNKIWE